MSYRKLQAIHKYGNTCVFYHIKILNLIHNEINANSNYTSIPFFSYCLHDKLLQSCPTLCDPMDCSLPGSSVQGILQARILEWVAIASSRGSSQPKDRTSISYVSCIGRWVLYHECHHYLLCCQKSKTFTTHFVGDRIKKGGGIHSFLVE